MFFHQKSLLLLPVLNYLQYYYNAQWTVNLVTGRPTLRVRSPISSKLTFCSKFCYFSKILTFSKNSARDRAPPKQSLLTSFIASIAITFYTPTAFLKFTGTKCINFKHFSLQSVFFYQKSLLLLPVLDYHSTIILLQEKLPALRLIISFQEKLSTLRVTLDSKLKRPVNCQPCFGAPNS